MCLSTPIGKPICTKLFKPYSNNDDLIWGAGAQLQAQACVSCLLVMPQNTFTDKKEKNVIARMLKTTLLLNFRAFPHKQKSWTKTVLLSFAKPLRSPVYSMKFCKIGNISRLPVSQRTLLHLVLCGVLCYRNSFCLTTHFKNKLQQGNKTNKEG